MPHASWHDEKDLDLLDPVFDPGFAPLPEGDALFDVISAPPAGVTAPIGGEGGGVGGGVPSPAGPSPEEIYQDQLQWLNDWLGSPTFAETGGLPFASGPGSFFSEEGKLDQALTDLGYGFGETAGGSFVSARRAPGGGGAPGARAAAPTATFSSADINIPGAPEWWQAMVPDITNPISSYQTMANLMIPMLSPEDQRTVASNLFQSAPEQFGSYNPELLQLAPIPAEITPDIRRQFFSGDRATKTLDAFDRLLEVSGKTAEDFGPGYNFLRGLADTLQDFKLTSGASQLTETQQGSLLSALDPQLAQTKNKQLGAFGPIAKSFVNPFFSAGSLTGKVRTDFGSLISPPNPRYY